jgi:GTPase SAR1 family protein
MLDFLRLLKRRYQAIANEPRVPEGIRAGARSQLGSLELGEAFLERHACLEQAPTLPLQAAVIGPTQSGKSSVVNLILNQEYAGVSPLAGFTMFPQGFGPQISESDRQALTAFFHGYLEVLRDQKPADPNSAFSIRDIGPIQDSKTSNAIIWDTPDFDSIGSQHYFHSLLRTIALADVIVVVVSKDKYADQSVWQMLSLIEPLNQPTLVVLNKVQADTAELISRSFLDKWQEIRSDSVPSIVPFPFHPDGLHHEHMPEESGRLFNFLQQYRTTSNRATHRETCSALLNRYWENWTEPLREEQAQAEEWKKIIDDATNSSTELYQRYYLDHPQHFETLKRALAELLTLLEIPGIAPLLAKTRSLLTWPIRHIFSSGQNSSDNEKKQFRESHEFKVLERIYEHYVTQVSNAIISMRAENSHYEYWWNELYKTFENHKTSLSENYQASVEEYQKDFQPCIEEVAHRLYNKLKQQPATLTSLRATRLTTDAAAVAIALKTGGIGVHDFVITPAVLSMTSYLTESALGHYMRKIEAELKQMQLKAVASNVFGKALKKPLQNIPADMCDQTRFNIPAETLEQATETLRDL